MKRLAIAVTLALMGCAGASAAGPADPRPDGIGVYADAGGVNWCIDGPAPYTPLTVYLVGTRLSLGGASGWEGTLLVNPTSWPAGLTLNVGAGAVNLLTAPTFHVVLSPARMGSEVVLLTISTFYLGGPIAFGIAPSVPSSFDGLTPGYADPVNPAVWLPLSAPSNVPWTLLIYRGLNADLPANGPANGFLVATIPCMVDAVERTTWGGVKGLYK